MLGITFRGEITPIYIYTRRFVTTNRFLAKFFVQIVVLPRNVFPTNVETYSLYESASMADGFL